MAEKEIKKADKPLKEKKKSDKPSFWQKLSNFFRNYKSEFKKVSWCPRKQTLNNSVVVIISIIVSLAFLMILDFGYAQGFEKLRDLTLLF